MAVIFQRWTYTISNQAKVLDTVALNELIQTTEIISISKDRLAKLKNSNNIEGIYYSIDSTYKIALIKNKSTSRHYAGIIISSENSFWKPGQVKLELKQSAKNEFKATVYLKNHSIQFQDFIFDGNSFNNGAWVKEGTAPCYKQTFYTIQSKKISDKTIYIGIGTFEEWNARAIDSTFKANEAVLKSVPNLILDRGGMVVAPIFHTGPYHLIYIPTLFTISVWTYWLQMTTSKAGCLYWKIMIYPRLQKMN